MTMAKPKKYGMATKYNPRLHLDMRYQKKQHQRQRESVTRKPVAAQIVKEKEAPNNGDV